MKLPSISFKIFPASRNLNFDSSFHTKKAKAVAGFSVVEILLVISIILVLSVALITRFNGANASNALKDNQAKVINILEEARNRSASGADNSDHGVHIEEHELTLFNGQSYVPGDGKIITFPEAISLSSASATIIFKRIAATADPTTTITVANIAGDNLQIFIDQNGTITPN